MFAARSSGSGLNPHSAITYGDNLCLLMPGFDDNDNPLLGHAHLHLLLHFSSEGSTVSIKAQSYPHDHALAASHKSAFEEAVLYTLHTEV